MSDTNLALGDGLLPEKEVKKRKGPPFLKLTPGQKLEAIILSDVWTGAITHFTSNRMTLHQLVNCPHCAAGSDRRWYSWIHCVTHDGANQFILQLASSMRPVLSKHHDEYHTLRGAAILIRRNGKSPNTPTTIEFVGHTTHVNKLPEAIDLKLTLLAVMDPTAYAKANPVQKNDLPGQKELPL